MTISFCSISQNNFSVVAQHLKYENKGGVAVIKFDSPGVKVCYYSRHSQVK